MNRFSCALIVIAVLTLIVEVSGVHAQVIAFDSERWEIDARESRVEMYKGRQSLYIKGGVAWIDDAFTNGIIEFDVSFSGARGFMGGIWRMQDRGNYEEFYIRPHQSGNPDANQYTPVINGLSGWQLYHGEGYGTPVSYPFDQWIHVKIVFSGSQGEVYIDSEEPVLLMHDLKHEVHPGKVGVSVSNFAPAYFSNFTYQKVDAPVLQGTPAERTPTPRGTVMAWSVSNAFDEASLNDKIMLSDSDQEGLQWTTLAAEHSGITNLAHVQGPAQGANTTFARITITAEQAQVKKIRFGYSDRVKVFVNGRLVYGGTNQYVSRDYRYLGTIGLFDEVYVPLEAGTNEVWFAVSESFGGWGILGVIDDQDGVTITP